MVGLLAHDLTFTRRSTVAEMLGYAAQSEYWKKAVAKTCELSAPGGMAYDPIARDDMQRG